MAGINWDAEMNKYYPDPQENEAKIYCDCCEGLISDGEEYVKIPNKYNFCMSCIEEWITQA